MGSLRARGHDVRAVAEDQPGAADTEVLRQAQREERILLTSDKDFARLVFEARSKSRGIILLRLKDWTPEQKARRLLEVLERDLALLDALVVVLPRTVRRRALGGH